MDPPTHFYSQLGFLELFYFAMPLGDVHTRLNVFLPE